MSSYKVPRCPQYLHPSAWRCRCCTKPWKHGNPEHIAKLPRPSFRSTGEGIHIFNHTELPVPHDTRLSYTDRPTSAGLPQGPTILTAQPAWSSLPSASVAAWPCQNVQGCAIPKNLSSSFPHRLLQLVVSCTTSHAGSGGRQLSELNSPSSTLTHGRWNQYDVKLHSRNSRNTKEREKSMRSRRTGRERSLT